jgi:hypothetical protein
MKTLKVVLVATMVAFVMVAAANADGFKSKPKFTNKVNITIENAVKNPGLVAAMYDQLNENVIGPLGLPPFIFDVKYNGTIYRISGNRAQWIHFFRTRGISPCEKSTNRAVPD